MECHVRVLLPLLKSVFVKAKMEVIGKLQVNPFSVTISRCYEQGFRSTSLTSFLKKTSVSWSCCFFFVSEIFNPFFFPTLLTCRLQTGLETKRTKQRPCSKQKNKTNISIDTGVIKLPIMERSNLMQINNYIW